MKLDRSKPFGLVSGEHDCRFEQGGHLFGADDEELVAVVDEDDKVPNKSAPDAPAPDKVKAAPKSAVKAPVKAAAKSHKKQVIPVVPPIPSLAAVADAAKPVVSAVDAQLAKQV